MFGVKVSSVAAGHLGARNAISPIWRVYIRLMLSFGAVISPTTCPAHCNTYSGQIGIFAFTVVKKTGNFLIDINQRKDLEH